MKTLFSTFLILHIISGGSALILGLIGMISAKGQKVHRWAGKMFFWAMLSVFVTSLYMSLSKNNWFLLCVGFFSFYMTCSGYLILKIRSNEGKKKFLSFYRFACWVAMIAGFSMLVLSVTAFYKKSSFAIVPLVLGSISILLSRYDYRILSGKILLNKVWLQNHGQRMAGAFATTLTAFVVVNIQIEQRWILWLLPAFSIVPLTRRMLKAKNRLP